MIDKLLAFKRKCKSLLFIVMSNFIYDLGEYIYEKVSE